MRFIVIFLAFVFVLGGCVTRGTKFDMAVVDSFQVNVTTKEEAIAKLGKPKSVANYSNGTALLQWMFVEASPIHGKGAHVSILFDQDSKMIRVANRTE